MPIYREEVNDCGRQVEYYDDKKLEPNYFDYFPNIEIYYHILRKHNLNGHANEAVFKDYKTSYLKGHLIDCIIKPTMNDDAKIRIYNDIEIACEDWDSRFVRDNMATILKVTEKGDKERIEYTDGYITYHDKELDELRRNIVLYLYNFCDKYRIEHNDVYFKPWGNGFADIIIKGSNKINEQQVSAIERICRATYDYGEVKFDRDGEIENIDHHFRTKYYAGRYTNEE